LTGPGGLSGRSASCGFAGLPFPGIALRDRGGWPAGRDGAGRGGRAIRGGSSAGLNATGGLVEESARMAPGGLFGGEDAPAAEGGARAGGARGEDRLPGRGSARGGHEGGGELVRRRRSRESDAGSGKRRLIFCPSPFAAARLPCSPPSSFLRSLGLPALSLPPAPLLPRLSLAFSRPSPGSAGFPRGRSWGRPCPPELFGLAQPGPRRGRSRGVPVFHRVAGLAPGNPDRSRRWIPPGPGGPKAARRPQVRAAPLVVSLMVSLVVSLVVSLRVGSGEGDRARPGVSGRLCGKEPRQVPDPGDSLKTLSWSTRQGSAAFR